MAMTPTMSSAVQPRDRSFTGLGYALRDGTVGFGMCEALHELVADVTGVKVGEHEHVGAACYR